MKNIPEKVVNYNVYDGNEKLVGIAGAITLPNLEAMSETISGAGILGEYDSVSPGHFGPTPIEIPFRLLYDSSFSLFVPGKKTIILRASQQSYNVNAGKTEYRGLKITLKGAPKGLNLGSLEVGKPTESTNSIELHYIKIEENGNVLLELDKFNFIFAVNGVDVLKDIRSQI